MKQHLIVFGLLFFCLSCSKPKQDTPLRSLISKQLQHSYTEENWFVPVKVAINGLTAEQANWKDSTDNHSIGELVSHLTFWNEMQLRAFKGEDFSDLEINNDTTFVAYTDESWEKLVQKLDRVQIQFQLLIDHASEEELSAWHYDILNMASHNAYHAGQVIYIRKQKGWWNRKK